MQQVNVNGRDERDWSKVGTRARFQAPVLTLFRLPLKLHPVKSKTLSQANALRDLLFQSALGAQGRDIAALAIAWDKVCDRARIIRGRPLPGALKPEKPKSTRTSKDASFLEDVSIESSMPASEKSTQESGAQELRSSESAHVSESKEQAPAPVPEQYS